MIEPALAARLARVEQRPPLVQGQVTAVAGDGTCTVALFGGPTGVAGVKSLSSYSPSTGDVVWVYRHNRDLWIVGSLQRHEATPYTPTLRSTGGAVTLGTAGLSGRYERLTGRMVAVSIRLDIGTGMTLPAGTYSFDLPTPARGGPPYGGLVAMFMDQSAALPYIGMASAEFSGVPTDRASIHFHGMVGAWAVNTPVAWAAGDSVTVNGTYEAAS